jgi:hypothetical protein
MPRLKMRKAEKKKGEKVGKSRTERTRIWMVEGERWKEKVFGSRRTVHGSRPNEFGKWQKV